MKTLCAALVLAGHQGLEHFTKLLVHVSHVVAFRLPNAVGLEEGAGRVPLRGVNPEARMP